MTAADLPLPSRFDSPPEEIEARLRRARRAGHPRYVWDDLPMSAWAAGVLRVEDAVRAVLEAQRGVAGGATAALDPAGAVTPRALGVAAFTTGMAPLLGHWIEVGALLAAEEVAAVLAASLAHARARAERIHDLLATLAPASAGAGVRPVVLKGSHTAWRYFPEPGARPTADVDLLVPPDAGPAMERVLAEAGHTLIARQPRPARSVWRPPGEDGRLRSLELTHAHNPLTLDLHLSLDRGFYGVSRSRLPDPGEEDLEPVPGLPPPYLGLRGALLLLSLALHASEDLYNLQLVKVVELVLVSRGVPDPPGLWSDTLEAGRRAHALGDAFPALVLMERLDPGVVPADVVAAARTEAPPALRSVVEGLSPATAQRLEGITLRERLAGARTPAEKLRRIAHMLVPDSAAGSWRTLFGLYLTRGYQLLGGRVRLGPATRKTAPARLRPGSGEGAP